MPSSSNHCSVSSHGIGGPPESVQFNPSGAPTTVQYLRHAHPNRDIVASSFPADAQVWSYPQFGMRVSVLLDANGANTTAAAAVRAAASHLELRGVPAL